MCFLESPGDCAEWVFHWWVPELLNIELVNSYTIFIQKLEFFSIFVIFSVIVMMGYKIFEI